MFIVVYDDDDCLCIPQTWDKNCAGALCSGTHEDAIAAFTSRSAARKAIGISAKFAALCKAQGKPPNVDFLGKRRRHLHIVPLQPDA